MASLTGCLSKTSVDPQDKRAILNRARALRNDGKSAAEAAEMAVDEQIAAVRALANVSSEGAANDTLGERVDAAETPKSATDWSNEMERLRKVKPRPLKKLYGSKGPTPEQAADHAAKERAWNSAYRKASAEQKRALERDNAAFRAAREPTPTTEATGEEAAAKPSVKESLPVATPLYASRPVLNAQAIIDWAASQGFKSTLPAADMHVTVAYSRDPMDGKAMKPGEAAVRVDGGNRTVEPLGDEGAVVLKFASPQMQSRWKEYRDAGASWDYESYTPHVTLTYDGKGVDLSKVKPYTGPIELGAEKQEALNVDKAADYKEAGEVATPSQPAPKEKASGSAAIPRGPAGDQMLREMTVGTKPEALAFLDAYRQWLASNNPYGMVKSAHEKPATLRAPDLTKKAREAADTAEANYWQMTYEIAAAKYEFNGLPRAKWEAERRKRGMPVDEAPKEKAEPAKGAKPTVISDAGEKIGGARKDRWKERGLNVADLDDMSEAEGATLATKANVWKPDYAAMVAAGTPPKHAALVKIIYDRLAAQPAKDTPAGRRNYVKAMQAVRTAFGSLDGTQDANKAVREAYLTFRSVLGYPEQRERGSDEQRALLFSIYKGRSDPFAVWYDEERKADKLVAEGFPAKVDPWKRRFDISRSGGAGVTEAGVTAIVAQGERLGTPVTAEQAKAGVFGVYGKTNRKAAGLAPSMAEAEALAADLYRKSLDKTTAAEPERPHLDHIKREGLGAGIDRDVTSQELLDHFGFKSVEYGNWAAQDERQRLLNFAYDALGDLAKIMNVPPKALSMNGTLSMAFGARGGGRFAAHYEPGKLVINMTKVNGAGSLAHELAHAFDHYLGELDTDNAYKAKARGATGWYTQGDYTGKPRNRMVQDASGKWVPGIEKSLPNLRPELADKINAVMRALYGTPYSPTNYAKEARALSGKSLDGYWLRPTEMWARAFESYVFDKLAAMGAKSQYLVQGVEQDRFASGYKGNPYPVGAEREAINKAFDEFVAELKTREEAGKTAMFSIADGTRAAYEARIDAIYAGGAPNRIGATVLDSSDMMRLLGYGDKPMRLVESKVRDGISNHHLTAEHWKRVPQWLENPAAVFDSETVPGRLVFVAPETINGDPVLMIVDPEASQADASVSILVNAYDRPGKKIPVQRWLKADLMRYLDEKTSPSLGGPSGLQLPRVNRPQKGSKQILLTQDDLVKMRGTKFDAAGIDRTPVTSDTSSYEPAGTADTDTVARLQASINRGQPRSNWVVLDAVAPRKGGSGSRGPELAAVATTAKRYFGHRVVWVKFTGPPLFNGAVDSAFPGVIFINADSQRPMMAVLGHELLHKLRSNNPALYRDFVKRISRVVKNSPDYAAALEAKYKAVGRELPKEWVEELHADIVGDFFTDPQFWQEMAKDQPGLFQRLANAILKFLDNAAQWFTKARPFGTERYLTDIAAARSAVVDAMRAYSRAETEPMADEVDGIRLSPADDKAEAPDAWMYRFWSSRTWGSEAEARDMMRRRIIEDNERYAGAFKPNDPALVDGLVFVKAPTPKSGWDKGKPQVKLKQPKAPPAPFARIGEPADSEGDDRPRVDWTSTDMADDGTADSVLHAYGRGNGNVYRAWVDPGLIPSPKGGGIRDGYPDMDGDYDWSELQRSRGEPPPLKVRVGKNGKLVLMDGNHRLAWWREQGHSEVPAYVIDERKGSEDVHFSIADQTDAPPSVKTSQDLLDAPPRQKGWVESARKAIEDAGDAIRPYWLALVTRDQIADMYGDLIPSVREYDELARSMENERSKMAGEADDLYNEWAKIDAKVNDRLARIMLDATVHGVHPDKAYTGNDPDAKAVHGRISAEFKTLPADAQAMYQKVKAFHEGTLTKLRNALEARIIRQVENGKARAAALDQIRLTFDQYLKNGPYFPLSRFGDYIVIAKKGDDKIVASYESPGQQKKAAAKLQAEGYTVKTKTAKQYSREQDGSAGKFVGDVMSAVEGLDLTDASLGGKMVDLKSKLLDEINQLAIKALPDLSYRKHFMHRKGTPGFTGDVMRSMASSAFHSASHIAKLNYGDKMTFALQDAESAMQAAEEGDFTMPSQVMNELALRHEKMLNPDTHPVAALLNQIGFTMYLGMSPAAGIVNALQTVMVTMPYLGARYGFTKTNAQMAAAYKDILQSPFNLQNGWNAAESKKLTAAEVAMMKALHDEGVIDLTQAHDLAAATSRDQGNVAKSKAAFAVARAARIIGWSFHVPEVMNRQVTALTAYRMEMAASKDDEKARHAARESIKRTQFDYAACVDEDTEILTNSGWKRYDALTKGDTAIAVDESGRAVQSTVQAINVYPGQHDVIEFASSRRFSMVVTPHHDCVIQTYNSKTKSWGRLRKERADEMKAHFYIPRSPTAPVDTGPGVMGEDFAAILGWIASEGWYAKFRNCKAANNVRLGQSLSHNPEYVDEISGILQRLGGHFTQHANERKRDTLVTFSLHRVLGKRIQEAMPDKVLTPELARAMSTAEKRAFLMAFLKGDGSAYDNEMAAWAVGQKNGANLDLLQAMATMCGMRSTLSPVNGNGMAMLYVVTGDEGGRTHVRPLKQERRTVPLVWCPTTEHGTWIARRNGTVFVTGNSNRARVMSGNTMRVITQFKQYSQNMTYLLARALHQSLKGETPEVRAVAIKQLIATFATTGAMAGVLGLPAVGTIASLVAALVSMADDDDKPIDWEVEFRNAMADRFGKDAGEAIAKGLPRLFKDYLPGDISARVGLADMWWRDNSREGDNPTEAWARAAQNLLGPTAGTTMSMFTAADHMEKGHWSKAIEAIVPKAIRDVLKAIREGTEGVTTYQGNQVMELTKAEVAAQALGFNPARKSEMFEGRNAVKNAETVLSERRQLLLSSMAKARRDLDTAKAAELQQQINAFNERNPAFRIRAADVFKSMQATRRAMAETVDGVRLPRKREDLRQEGRFANVQ